MQTFEADVEDLVSPDAERSQQARSRLLAARQTSLDYLIKALPRANERLTWKIIMILGEMGDPRAVPAFIQCLQSSSPAIRAAAAQFLSATGSEKAAEALRQMLSAGPDLGSLIWVIHALGKLGDRQAVDQLLQIVQETSSATVRYTAIEALGAIGDPRVIDVIRRYANDESRHVRDRVQTVLERFQAQPLPRAHEVRRRLERPFNASKPSQ